MFNSTKDLVGLKNNSQLGQREKEKGLQEELSGGNLSMQVGGYFRTTEKKVLARKDGVEGVEGERKGKGYNLTRSIDMDEWKQETREMKSSCSQTILHIDNHVENFDGNVSESEKGMPFLKCRNNDGKKAKYQTVSSKEEQGFYCLKCSIKLLQRGIQIIQIPEIPSKRLPSFLKPLTQQLTRSYNILQTNCKALQNNYFFVEIDQEKQKIDNIYNSIIQFIVQLKHEDLQKLNKIRSKILKESKEETFLLHNFQKRIKTILKDLSQFSQLEDSIQRMVRQASEKMIVSVGEYEPLEFSMKKEDVETVKERIFNRISKEFSDQEYPIHFSFNEKSEFLETSVSHPALLLETKEEGGDGGYQKVQEGGTRL